MAISVPAGPSSRPVPEPPFARHVLERTVVLPEQRILFLPMPKAGCTTVLWTLAGLAGLAAEDFAESAAPEASPTMSVHDLSRWRSEHRFVAYDDDDRDRILRADDWLRFTVVRDPAARLWSAWESKLLLREPRFVDIYGEAAWFPRLPEDPEAIVKDFRTFVRAVCAQTARDVHWSVQHDLATQLPLGHIGRVESLQATLDLLAAHVGREAATLGERRENRGSLPMPGHAYDAPAAAGVSEHYAGDYLAFRYPFPVPREDPAWAREVAPLLPVLRASIDERQMIGRLHRIAQRRLQRVRAAEQRLETASARHTRTSAAPIVTALEGDPDYTVRWAWQDGAGEPGFTGVVRARNEARSLPWTLPPLLAATDRVVLVDNGSTDGTSTVAQDLAARHGMTGRLEVHSYPFTIARCGTEHLATPATSVHSLVHFYNWSFSHVRTAYALKWDADMVMTRATVDAVRDLAWQLEQAEAIVRIPRHPLYLVDDRRGFVDTELRNCEAWGWPNRPGYSFTKALDWEMPMWGGDATPIELPDWGCVELKHLDGDEFSHWSDTDFASSARTRRKQREWAVFQALASGASLPDGVVEIQAPPERHIVEHVRETWLPARAATS